MEILQADIRHAKTIISKVTALITEIVGTPFVLIEAEVLEFLRDAMERGAYQALLAVDGRGRAIGVIPLGESWAVYAGGAYGVIHELYVDPDMRGRGIGRLLIEEAKQRSLERGWKRLEVSAPPFPRWKRSKDFYLREAFLEVGPRLRWPAW